MKLVADANVVVPALVADSKTRELLVMLEPDPLTVFNWCTKLNLILDEPDEIADSPS